LLNCEKSKFKLPIFILFQMQMLVSEVLQFWERNAFSGTFFLKKTKFKNSFTVGSSASQG